jgi:hypothetical protein
MAIKLASWIHGNAFAVPEAPGFQNLQVGGIPWTDIVGLHRGWGQTWRGKQASRNWFHVAIPTPVIVDDTRLRLDKVFVLFNAGVSCDVTDVHVWDGPRQVQTFGTFRRTGDHCGALDGDNTFDISGNPEVFLGVGVSVFVTFNLESDITFCSAGADFTV